MAQLHPVRILEARHTPNVVISVRGTKSLWMWLTKKSVVLLWCNQNFVPLQQPREWSVPTTTIKRTFFNSFVKNATLFFPMSAGQTTTANAKHKHPLANPVSKAKQVQLVIERLRQLESPSKWSDFDASSTPPNKRRAHREDDMVS